MAFTATSFTLLRTSRSSCTFSSRSLLVAVAVQAVNDDDGHSDADQFNAEVGISFLNQGEQTTLAGGHGGQVATDNDAQPEG